MTVELRPDGWYLLGTFGEVIGPFADKTKLEEFLDYLDTRK